MRNNFDQQPVPPAEAGDKNKYERTKPEPGVDMMTREEMEAYKTVTQDRAMDLQRFLFMRPVYLSTLKEIGADTLEKAFLPWKYSFLPGEKEMHAEVLEIIEQVRNYQEGDEDVLIRPIMYDKDDQLYLDALAELSQQEEIQNLLQERGFESLEQVDVKDITVDEIIKLPYKTVQDGPLEYIEQGQAVALQARGTITIDSPLLTETARQYPWNAEFKIQIPITKQILMAENRAKIEQSRHIAKLMELDSDEARELQQLAFDTFINELPEKQTIKQELEELEKMKAIDPESDDPAEIAEEQETEKQHGEVLQLQFRARELLDNRESLEQLRPQVFSLVKRNNELFIQQMERILAKLSPEELVEGSLELKFDIDLGDDVAKKDGHPLLLSDANDGGTRLTKRQATLLKEFGFDNNFAGDNQTIDMGDTLSMNVGGIIHFQLREFLYRNFNPEVLQGREMDASAYELHSDISKLKEKDIKEMYRDALKTRQLPELLLYTGEGADYFLETVERENQELLNQEREIARENMEVLLPHLQGKTIYELGPGDASNTVDVLNAVLENNSEDVTYRPYDIHASMIAASAQTISEEVSDPSRVKIKGIHGDFHELHDKVDTRDNVFIMYGITIANFEIPEQIELLKDIKAGMQPGEVLIIGLQMKQDLEGLVAAYSDEKCEAFHREVAKEYGISSDILEYSVVPDEEHNQLEMRLTFQEDTTVTYNGSVEHFTKGDYIRTAVSHKYIPNEISTIFDSAGFTIKEQLTKGESVDEAEYIIIVAEA